MLSFIQMLRIFNLLLLKKSPYLLLKNYQMQNKLIKIKFKEINNFYKQSMKNRCYKIFISLLNSLHLLLKKYTQIIINSIKKMNKKNKNFYHNIFK